MNRVLEKVFPAFSRHAQARVYYTYPEGSKEMSFVFHISYTGNDVIHDGRVVLFFAPSADPEPRFEVFELEDLRPVFAKDIQNVHPGDVIAFESTDFSLPDALGFVPADLSNFQTNELYVQALFSKNLSDPDANTCPGNMFSTPIRVELAPPAEPNVVSIVADQLVADGMDITNTEWVEHISMKSELLSAYHGQDVHISASVVLPHGYHTTSSSASHVYPTVFYIEGFTGTEAYATRARAFLSSEMGRDWQAGKWPTPMLRVTLGSRFKFGHTSFADSESNGPWGSALVQEFIPFFEAKYPSAVRGARGRYLHGHSSGGWSTLWLQLQFPDVFNGTWSTAPDPVDFSRFQIVNIYESENMYWDPYGRPYPTYRNDGQIVSSIRDENLIERVYARGNGGQWGAFCAVFGPRDPETGMPRPLFDQITGEIDASVAQAWTKYDIVKFLKTHPELLADKLSGKVHVICGTEDNYYLNGACQSLQTLLRTKAKAETAAAVPNYVQMVAGDHTTIRNRKHYEQIYSEIAHAFLLK
uniref:Uncharacterized protein n=1 Tax=Globisporangium ultimum (strain ATCC 200006 / CBS 805.95 / DAOM BR144) TaxID=431595 RepID=K3WE82_GLOUD